MAYFCLTFAFFSNVKFTDHIKKNIGKKKILSTKKFIIKWGVIESNNSEYHDDGDFITCDATNDFLEKKELELFIGKLQQFHQLITLKKYEIRLLETHLLNVVLIFQSGNPENLFKLSKFRGIIAKNIRDEIQRFGFNKNFFNHINIEFNNFFEEDINFTNGIPTLFNKTQNRKKNDVIQQRNFDPISNLNWINFKQYLNVKILTENRRNKIDNYRYEVNLILSDREWEEIIDKSFIESEFEYVISNLCKNQKKAIDVPYGTIYYWQDELLIWKLEEQNNYFNIHNPDFFDLFKGELLLIAERLIYCCTTDIYICLFDIINNKSNTITSEDIRNIIAYYESILGRIFLQRALIEGWHFKFIKEFNFLDMNDQNREMFRSMQRAVFQSLNQKESEQAENSRDRLQTIIFVLTSLTLFSVYTDLTTFIEDSVLHDIKFQIGYFFVLGEIEKFSFFLIILLIVCLFVKLIRKRIG